MKPTIKSLTKKGLSQKKIALLLHIRKTKVVAEQKKLRIGKRVASGFWSDVKKLRDTGLYTHREATEAAKKTTKWVDKRWERMSKKRRDLATKNVQHLHGYKGAKQAIIERYMEQHGYSTMNEARDAWERGGS